MLHLQQIAGTSVDPGSWSEPGSLFSPLVITLTLRILPAASPAAWPPQDWVGNDVGQHVLGLSGSRVAVRSSTAFADKAVFEVHEWAF